MISPINELQAIDEILRDLYETETERHVWLHAPQNFLAGSTPIDLITGGRVQRVLILLRGLVDG